MMVSEKNPLAKLHLYGLKKLAYHCKTKTYKQKLHKGSISLMP
jgi:hypothetical protein